MKRTPSQLLNIAIWIAALNSSTAITLSILNDSREYSLEEIADVIEKAVIENVEVEI